MATPSKLLGLWASIDQVHERLKLLDQVRKSDDIEYLEPLQTVHVQERVAWLKRRIKKEINRLSLKRLVGTPGGSDATADLDQIRRQLEVQSVNQVASLLTHEVDKIVGKIRMAASRELPNFAQTDTAKFIDILIARVSAIRSLRDFTSSPSREQFEIRQFIQNLVIGDIKDEYSLIDLAGPELLVVADKEKLGLAISNGMRNALEATDNPNPGYDERRIVVDWGESDVDYFVSISDCGVGLVDGAPDVFDFGATSKDTATHMGFGLPAAKYAILAMDGDISLDGNGRGGATFRLEWPK